MQSRLSLPVVGLAAFALVCPGEGSAAALTLKVSLGYHYSTGTYGTSDTTEVAYVPFIAKAEIGAWTIQGTVPYLRISGPAGFAAVGDTVVPTAGGTADGLGDVILRGAYTVDASQTWMPFVDVAALIKFPTASRGDGLGTGEFDYGVETELFWSMDRFTPYVTIGYRFLGSPPDTNLDNVFLGSVGAIYRIIEPVHAGLFLDYRQSPAASVGERLELIPFGSWQIDPHWSVDLYASAGLAKGSPDAGTGLQVAYAW
jgi:hypothetical protein